MKLLILAISLLGAFNEARADLWMPEPVCEEQQAQAFLIRANMLHAPEGFKKAVAAAIKYRVEQYSWVSAAPKLKALNPVPVTEQVEATHFLGRPVTLHKKVIPAVKCAEAAILNDCSAEPYRPEHLSGLRLKNSYRGGEISNHMFGLALDIDPDRNPCCGCVKPWSEAPQCRKPARSPLDRVAMPRCWIDSFERYGFYWLGWDEMQDTMHFEFLGDPAKIAPRTAERKFHAPFEPSF